jgi:hypothetical protein
MDTSINNNSYSLNEPNNEKKEEEVLKEKKFEINDNILDTAEKFETYTKLLTASSKIADEARHLNKLIAEANTKLLIIARRKANIEAKQQALWKVYSDKYDKPGPYLFFSSIIHAPSVNTTSSYSYDANTGSFLNDDNDSLPSTPKSTSSLLDEDEDDILLASANLYTQSSNKRQKI